MLAAVGIGHSKLPGPPGDTAEPGRPGTLAPSDARPSCSDQALWRSLWTDHFRWISRLVLRLGVPFSEVEDVTQNVFLRAHDHLTELREVQNVGGWLRGVTVRVVSEHRRWRRVRRIKDWLLQSRVAEDLVPTATPEQNAEALRAHRLVSELLDQMGPKLREVLVLMDLEQCTPLEVAETLGLPVNTVKSRRRLAREEFQRLHEKREKQLARASRKQH
jgi:RNA polymerase sigma-70 factor (ECF subfamily)